MSRSSAPAPVDRTQSDVDFHRGEVLWTLANTYPDLGLTIVETIQNPLDADAQNIFVGINLRQRTLIVADDGLGVDRETFEKALASVGHGIKSKDKLGRFGRGLISPMNKCTSFTFTSVCVTASKPNRWTFKGSEIRKQHHRVQIPCSVLREMPKIPKPFTDIAVGGKWRTIVALNGVTKDKAVGLVDLDSLESLIRSKLGLAMRRKHATITIALLDDSNRVHVREIDPVSYSGEALPVVKYSEMLECGEVAFELFRAPKLGGKRQGEVVVMEKDGNYPVTMSEFIRQARGRKWADGLEPAFAALGSGYFEGVIKCQNVELAPERTKFEYNDALMGLYLVIGQWFSDHGEGHHKNEQEVSRERRYQELGLKSLHRIHDLLRQPDYGRLWDGLKNVVEIGRLGHGHVDPESGDPDGLEDDNSIRVGQGGAGSDKPPAGDDDDGESTGPDKPRSGSGKSPTRPKRDRPGDTPKGVNGPSGQRRRLVTGDSTGLWFAHEPIPGNMHVWEFDFTRGILTFNTRHPIWVKLDESNGKHMAKNSKWIMHFQEWLALQVLHLLMHFPDADQFEHQRAFVDDQLRHYVELFILNDPNKRSA